MRKGWGLRRKGRNDGGGRKREGTRWSDRSE